MLIFLVSECLLLTYHNKRNKINKAELIPQGIIELQKETSIMYYKGQDASREIV